MAVPARRVSKAKKNSRRSSVWKLESPTLVRCDHCKKLTVPHRACGYCGYYKGNAVVEMEDED